MIWTNSKDELDNLITKINNCHPTIKLTSESSSKTIKYLDLSISIQNVTGSAKTGHNRTSLNLQYKALNTWGACLHIIEKIL